MGHGAFTCAILVRRTTESAFGASHRRTVLHVVGQYGDRRMVQDVVGWCGNHRMVRDFAERWECRRMARHNTVRRATEDAFRSREVSSWFDTSQSSAAGYSVDYYWVASLRRFLRPAGRRSCATQRLRDTEAEACGLRHIAGCRGDFADHRLLAFCGDRT